MIFVSSVLGCADGPLFIHIAFLFYINININLNINICLYTHVFLYVYYIFIYVFMLLICIYLHFLAKVMSQIDRCIHSSSSQILITTNGADP